MFNDFYKKNISIVTTKAVPFSLTSKSRSFFIGSCFSSNLYSKFKSMHLNSHIAPFGNIYNPLSLAKALDRVIENTHIKEDECFQADGLYQHFDFYSKSGNSDIKRFLTDINHSISNANKELLAADMLIITLGTAWVYEKQGNIVNNCHKLPKDTFARRLLNLEEITRSINTVLEKLLQKNTKINIVITLSPVRHLRDNATDNSLSKSMLRVAIEEITKKSNAVYFPSYEIVMDELRDYRWYKDDLAHPTEKAVDYIIDRFIECSGSDEFIDYIKRVTKLNSLINHKIINQNSDSSKDFIVKKRRAVEQFIKDYPYLDNLNISEMINNHL